METDAVLQKIGECEEVIEIVTTPARLFILVAQLQLALRHPGNIGNSAAIVYEMALNLTEMICSKIPEARGLIEMGWDPELDVTREEYQALVASDPATEGDRE